MHDRAATKASILPTSPHTHTHTHTHVFRECCRPCLNPVPCRQQHTQGGNSTSQLHDPSAGPVRHLSSTFAQSNCSLPSLVKQVHTHKDTRKNKAGRGRQELGSDEGGGGTLARKQSCVIWVLGSWEGEARTYR